MDVRGTGGLALEDVTATGTITAESDVGYFFIVGRGGRVDCTRCSFYLQDGIAIVLQGMYLLISLITSHCSYIY